MELDDTQRPDPGEAQGTAPDETLGEDATLQPAAPLRELDSEELIDAKLARLRTQQRARDPHLGLMRFGGLSRQSGELFDRVDPQHFSDRAVVRRRSKPEATPTARAELQMKAVVQGIPDQRQASAHEQALVKELPEQHR